MEVRFSPSALYESALCNLKSVFRNQQSAIVDPVARPPRLSEQARDGGQARASSWSRGSNS
jgi:hypothetical protein